GVPGDISVECNAIPAPPTVTATDNCDPNPKVTYSEQKINGNCPGNFTLKRTWTATDASGNTVSATQTITVHDTTKPVLVNVPADVTVECDKVPPAATNVTATDNCDSSPRVSFSETKVAGNCAGNYALKRTWTATDNCGNTASATQTVTVHDTTKPVL